MPSDDPGQLLLIGIPGKELTPEFARMIRAVRPGGFILFGRNIADPVQLRRLLDDLRDASDVEPILTIDQEGGRVSRLRLLGSEPPSASQLCDAGQSQLISVHGELTAKILRLFGFNLDLCPVLDICFDENADNSLRGRCYGKTPEQVITNARLFNDALRAGGILSCGKHFPGYSRVGLDPHHELPLVNLSWQEIDGCELAVFKNFSPELDSMMIGHVQVPALDPSGRPASLSPKIIHELLRSELGFEGLVMTDDLDMGALLNHFSFEKIIRLGQEAGSDLLMLCHRVELAGMARSILETTSAQLLEPALSRVANFKSNMQPPSKFSVDDFLEIDKKIYELRVAVLGPELAAIPSPEDGKRSPVELY